MRGLTGRLVAAGILGCSFFLPLSSHAQPDNRPLTAEAVRATIDRGIRYLKTEQSRETGTWTRYPNHAGGVTALCALSLLNAGVDPDDPVIQRALAFLDKRNLRDPRDSVSVYSVSLMTMVYCMADPDKYRIRIRECVKYLEETQVQAGRGAVGGWPYNRQRNRPDASNSQFALLALHEASLAGVKCDEAVWHKAAFYWDSVYTDTGPDSGGFQYTLGGSVARTGSMTCAGISSLIIIDENLPKPLPVENGQVQCCTDEGHLEKVEKANQWIADRFTVKSNPADGGRNFFQNNVLYYLYGMERAGRLSGERYFGDHDWYREGARYLLTPGIQSANGSWKGSASHGENDPNIATAFALLFLSKGKRPIVIGKYKHSHDNDWDRHRTGVHYLTRSIEADWEMQLNWQTIKGSASADDLLEAPVLFISGRDGLKLHQSQKDALKEYIEYGGFVFAEACQGDGCGEGVGFDRDFQALMEELFPDSQLQLLDPTHPVFSSQYDLPVNPDRPLYGLQSSCRTSVIYCPANLSGFWRLKKPSFWARLGGNPKDQVDYVTKLGINVVSYATGRELKDKLDRPTVVDALDDGLGERVVLIPKLTHAGGADDAPNAWLNILRRARFDLNQRFKLERKFIEPGFEQLADHPMVFMHGRGQFQWTGEQRQTLATYFENGGFLFADSICSAGAFAESFRHEMSVIFPDAKLQVIPPTHRIWSGDNGGYLLDSVTMHRPGDGPGGIQRERTPPQLEGIEVDGRLVVVFSPHDLSCAMENASASQCPGYDKDDAARIGVNVIRYALSPW